MTQENTKMWKGIAILFVLLGHLNLVPVGGANWRHYFLGAERIWAYCIIS